MKKLLIISQHFAPTSSVGALRPSYFAKYLPVFGWQPLVFTSGAPTGHAEYTSGNNIEGLPGADFIIKTTYTEKERKKIQPLSWFNKLNKFFKPDQSHPPNFLDCMLSNLNNLNKWKPDLVLATCPPLGTLTIAKKIGEKFNIPIIADFRDLVEQEAGMDTSFRGKLLLKRNIMRRKNLLKNVSAVLSVSDYHCNLLKRQNKNVHLVYNGYDEEQFKPLQGNMQKKLKIGYFGRIIDLKLRDPRALLKALEILKNEDASLLDDLLISFFGAEKEIIEGLTEYSIVKEYIDIPERIPYDQINQIMNECSAFLLLTNEHLKGILTTKLFEYLPFKKPILCVPNDYNAIDTFFKKTSFGNAISSPKDIANWIKELHKNWVKDNKNITLPRSNFEQFSRKNQTKVLADIMDLLVKK